MYSKIQVLFLKLVYLTLCSQTHSAKVLLVSMDGFRWDYIQHASTPTFDSFAARGTRAPYINNTFITKTFPCHYSIATGLYEETHGIIANHMYDPDLNETFGMGTTDSKWWDGGEPIWVTARRAGLKSATYFWPGSEAEVRGLRPNIYLKYNESIPFTDRVDTVTNWLSKPEFDIDFAMLYFHEPDLTGHYFGPNSQQVREKVTEMDKVLKHLVQKFDEKDLWNNVNVIVTSDHGMTEIDIPTKNIDLLTYVNDSDILLAPSLGPVANIMATPGKIDTIMDSLKNVEHLEVYKRQDVPDHWHYSNNKRILDIVAVAEEGWVIVKNLSATDPRGKGTHGYDNRLSSMKPIFYARGPNIRSGHEAAPFNSVDIYPLVCEILGIKPAPNNGTLANTKSFIITTTTSAATSQSSLYHIIIFVVAIFLTFFSKYS